jgi:hypothetical protein
MRTFKAKKPRARKPAKFSRIERAIFTLACEIEALPICEVRVKDMILGILGFEEVKTSRHPK